MAKETIIRMNRQFGRKFLPDIHLTGDYYPEYIKNSKKLNTKSTNNPMNK
jgi:hypothetical protein